MSLVLIYIKIEIIEDGVCVLRRNLPERAWAIVILKELNVFLPDVIKYIADFLVEIVCGTCGICLPVIWSSPENHRHRYCVVIKRARDVDGQWASKVKRIANEEETLYLNNLEEEIGMLEPSDETKLMHEILLYPRFSIKMAENFRVKF